MTSTAAFCVIANCLSQVKQVPIFLGRRKRQTNDDDDDKITSLKLLAPTESPLATESTTQLIEFNLNGKNEQFIIARQVTVEVIPTETNEELDFESEALINNETNSIVD